MLGASVAIAVLWRRMFEVDGLVNQVPGLFGFEATTSWIGHPSTALWTIILLHVWTLGSPMVIFLAGLRQVDAQHVTYGTSQLDGRPPVERFSPTAHRIPSSINSSTSS
jgi:multiple sugar transport system permease protein